MPLKKLPGTEFIYERISDDGRLTSYQVKIRRKGFPTQTKSFNDLEAAKVFVRQVLNDQDRGHKVDRLASHRTSVGDVIDGEIKRLETGIRDVKGDQSELYRLHAFRRDFVALCAIALADVTVGDFEDWMQERLETVVPGTILREIRQLKPIFVRAAVEYDLRYSPMGLLKNPSVIDERIRRLSPDEEALLFAELADARDPIVLKAAEFALEAGCRRSEQLRVEWKDYKPAAGTIWLPDAKNGRGRHLLLTVRAQEIIDSLPGRREGGQIFKATGNQLRLAFTYGRERAAAKAQEIGRTDLVSIGSFRWHDLRHEAISRCFDEGWTTEQVMDFSGHVDVKSLLRYRHPKVDQAVARLRALEATRQAQLPRRGDMIGRIVDERVVIEG